MDKAASKKAIPLLSPDAPIPIFVDEPVARKLKVPTEWHKSKFVDADEATTSLYDQIVPSVVFVKVDEGTGSGCVIKNGNILTAEHVINGAKKITVETAYGESLPAVVIERDAYNDVAILKPLKQPAVKLPELKLETSAHVKASDKVYCFGHPLGLKPTYVAIGQILGVESLHRHRVKELAEMTRLLQGTEKSKALAKQKATFVAHFIQESNHGAKGFWHRKQLLVSMAGQNGLSGGPLVNSAGHIVGVDSTGFRHNTKIGFAQVSNGFVQVEHIAPLLHDQQMVAKRF